MPNDDTETSAARDYDGCGIPPEVYEIGFGWDPTPEAQRLLFLARTHGIEVRSTLELGCGAGRLLHAMKDAGVEAVGIELQPDMAERARDRSGVEVVTGDMTAFDLGRQFDLVYTSANTIRHVLEDDAISRMWRCVGAHLVPGGVFVADLELGRAAEAANAGKPASWSISRGDRTVDVRWEVVDPPSDTKPRTGIEWRFSLRNDHEKRTWKESFPLRAYDATEFATLAKKHGDLSSLGFYELRDPYLFERSADRAAGRFLVALQR